MPARRWPLTLKTASRIGVAAALLIGLALLARSLALSGSPHPTHNAAGLGESASTPPLDQEMVDILAMIRNGLNDAARLRLQRHLARDPAHAHAHFLFGLSFHTERRYGRARESFERAIELMPGFHPTHHFYGYCLYYLGELDAARAAFKRHLALRPDEGDSHFGLGLIDLDENHLEAAEQRFRNAIALDERAGRIDGVSKAHARLGETYERMNNLERAREHLERATDLYPRHYEAFYMLYRVLMRLGDEAAAEAALAAHEEYKQLVRPEPPPATGQ